MPPPPGARIEIQHSPDGTFLSTNRPWSSVRVSSANPSTRTLASGMDIPSRVVTAPTTGPGGGGGRCRQAHKPTITKITRTSAAPEKPITLPLARRIRRRLTLLEIFAGDEVETPASSDPICRRMASHFSCDSVSLRSVMCYPPCYSTLTSTLSMAPTDPSLVTPIPPSGIGSGSV